jgi:protein SCO1/2
MRPATCLILAAVAAATVGCGPSAKKTTDPDDLPLLGTKPFSFLPKPEFTLTDTRGQPYDFRKKTDGKIALLYFGYTYCPDTCPLMMATLAAALKEVSPEVRSQVRTVFVTVDPERDTADRLRSWLGSFDTSFVGLRGPMAVVDSLVGIYGFPPAKKTSSGDGYEVSHPAIVYAFTPDNKGRVMYESGTKKAQWVHDLDLIAHHQWHASADTDIAGATPAAMAAAAAARAATSDVRVLAAYAPAPPAGATTMAVYLTLLNEGTAADTLLGLDSDVSSMGSLHETTHTGNMDHMTPVAAIALPPGDTVRLAPGGFHGMLQALTRTPKKGDTLHLTLRLAHAGKLQVPARVVSYADLVR